ncbi:hypothetical protein KOW79_010161 [Hemibagrus wyckioides]|uniref:Uncharacterized protein n=1 Tax=Hemibagrus wyckioides TaxID=337641 RepID=A0A9D3NTC9_9TELE|nr:hypothetical protein KOW79_010161 [Hemibagrus wyckioides]
MSNQTADFLFPRAAGSLLEASRRCHGDEIKVWTDLRLCRINHDTSRSAESRRSIPITIKSSCEENHHECEYE